MPIRYKLTDTDGYTRRGESGETMWDEYAQVRITDGQNGLCGPGWTHVYTHPLLAELFDPIHGQYGKNAKLISVNVSGESKTDRGLKEGWTRVSFKQNEKRISVNLTQRTAFGILCAIKVYKDPSFQKWAWNWLSGKDRSACYAAYAANAADNAAANAAAAARAAASINLIKIAQQAMKIK